MSINIDRELSVREYALRENADFHAPYVPEFDFYFAVKNGDVAKVSSLCSVDFAKKSGFGKLCDDSLQIATQWEDYRCDLRAEAEGKMCVGVPVKEALPLVFDRDCRKLYKKLLRARYKLVKNTATDNH